jgi:hypothetical protein
MPAVDPLLTFASLLPRVADPWPDVIGLEFPFVTAGGGGVLASVFYSEGSTAQRDEAIRNGGTWGFWLGALFYALSFFNQVASTQ